MRALGSFAVTYTVRATVDSGGMDTSIVVESSPLAEICWNDAFPPCGWFPIVNR